MNFLKNVKTFTTNLKSTKELIFELNSLDKSIIPNLYFFSFLNILKSWQFILFMFFLPRIKNVDKVTFILSAFLIIIVTDCLLKYINVKKTVFIKRIRNYYNEKIDLKRLKLAKEIYFHKKIKDLSYLLEDFTQYNGGPLVNFYSLLEKSINYLFTYLISLSIVVLLSGNFKVAIIVFILNLLFLYCTYKLVSIDQKIEDENNKMQEKIIGANRLGNFYFSLLSEEFSKMKSVKLNNKNDFLQREYKNFLRPMIESMNVYNFSKSKLRLFSNFVVVIFYVVSIYLLYLNNYSFNILNVFIISTMLFSFKNLVFNINQVIENNKKFTKYKKFLNMKNIILDYEKTQLEPDLLIKVRDLNFSYDSKENLLKNINLDFKKNKIYAIVGENGAGKTTLVNLILNNLKYTSGSIEYNNCLGEIVSYCPQKVYIYSFKVGENLEFSTQYNKEDIETILRGVELENKINPDSKIGKDYKQDGINLSGGQSQRLAIARTVFNSNDILFFDEPTSALDINIEIETYNLLKRLRENSTVVFVTHRLASCKFADEIILIKNGEIKNINTHDYLLENDEYYRQLYNSSK